MNVWLVETGEPLPLQPGVRKMRTALLADNLAARGHQVRWWVSAFEHQRKLMLFAGDREVALSPGITLQVMRGCGYGSNISLARYLDHRLVARKFRLRARDLEPPDLIVAALPCYHLAFEAVRYGRQLNVPVLVDILDLWPDLLLAKLGNPLLHKLGQAALACDYARLHTLLKGATGLLAVSRGYLHWALKKAARSAREWDRVFLLGYQTRSNGSPPHRLPEWLRERRGQKLLLFIGTFGFSYELRLLVAAARRLAAAGRRDVCFVMVGTGEQAETVRRESAGLSNVVLPGWLDGAEIGSLLAHGYLGLAPYRLAPCEQDRLPYKPFEYLSAGLPLVSSLAGEMAAHITNHGLGINYRAGDLEGLCQAIASLLDDPAGRARMSLNARAFFKDHGDADRIYAGYAGHLESLAAAAAGRCLHKTMVGPAHPATWPGERPRVSLLKADS